MRERERKRERGITNVSSLNVQLSIASTVQSKNLQSILQTGKFIVSHDTCLYTCTHSSVTVVYIPALTAALQ